MTPREEIEQNVPKGEKFTVPDLVDRLHPEYSRTQRIAALNGYRKTLERMVKRGWAEKLYKVIDPRGRTETVWMLV